MFQLDLKSRKSIYEQVVDNLKELIVAGVLKQDEKLPSVRELSKSITVNPNTVQKAYRELENQGFVYTVTGLGTFVALPDTVGLNNAQVEEILEIIKNEIRELRFLGISPKDIRLSIEKVLDSVLEGGKA